MIHFISSRDRIGSSILTSLALHRCLGPSAPRLAQASPSHAVPRFKASDLPFTLATGPSSQASSDLLHVGHMTPCPVSCAMSSSIITCELISCVSHINTISPPKLSLNYQNQTRTFHDVLIILPFLNWNRPRLHLGDVLIIPSFYNRSRP